MTLRRTMPTDAELVWFKSSYSTGNGGECVEVAAVATQVYVRDSKQTSGAVLTAAQEAWAGLVRFVAG